MVWESFGGNNIAMHNVEIEQVGRHPVRFSPVRFRFVAKYATVEQKEPRP